MISGFVNTFRRFINKLSRARRSNPTKDCKAQSQTRTLYPHISFQVQGDFTGVLGFPHGLTRSCLGTKRRSTFKHINA